MSENNKDVSKTIRIGKKLNDQIFEIMKQPGNEDITFSDFVRDALNLYIQVLKYHNAYPKVTDNDCQ